MCVKSSNASRMLKKSKRITTSYALLHIRKDRQTIRYQYAMKYFIVLLKCFLIHFYLCGCKTIVFTNVRQKQCLPYHLLLLEYRIRCLIIYVADQLLNNLCPDINNDQFICRTRNVVSFFALKIQLGNKNMFYHKLTI